MTTGWLLSVAVLGFAYLAGAAVWKSTRQRVGTLDEIRTVVAALAAFLISGGAWTLVAL